MWLGDLHRTVVTPVVFAGQVNIYLQFIVTFQPMGKLEAHNTVVIYQHFNQCKKLEVHNISTNISARTAIACCLIDTRQNGTFFVSVNVFYKLATKGNFVEQDIKDTTLC